MVMPIIAYGKIKPLRQTKGLNQAEIAAELGVSRPTYVLIEQGSKEPTLTQLYILARLLGTEPGDLCSNLPAVTAKASDYRKFKDLVRTCVAQGTSGGTITKSKLSALTYLCDFAWYRLHGRPMTGADYRCTPRSPSADDFFRVVDELYEGQAITLEPSGTALLIKGIEVAQPTLLSAEESALVNEICTKWRNKSTDDIIAFTSRQAPCQAVKSGDLLPYEAIAIEPTASLY